jgi:hypothetical protein
MFTVSLAADPSKFSRCLDEALPVATLRGRLTPVVAGSGCQRGYSDVEPMPWISPKGKVAR